MHLHPGLRLTGRTPHAPARRVLLGLASLLLMGVAGYAACDRARSLHGMAPTRISVAGTALAVSLGFTVDTGLLSIGGPPIASALQLEGGAIYRFPTDFTPAAPDRYEVATVHDAILGPSRRLTADYRSHDEALEVTLEVVAAQQAPALLYRMETRALAEGGAVQQFWPLDSSGGGLALAGRVEYLTLLSTGEVQGTMVPGDEPVNLPLPEGAPLLLWSERAGRGYVLALLDEETGRTAVRLAPAADGELGLRLQTGPRAVSGASSPRLFIQRTETRDLTRVFATYRSVLDAVAPAPPIPTTFRQQWGSWYVYGGGVNEERIRQQIDTIAGTYADLGPWQVVIDAGWYLAGSHPDGEMGRVDPDKFPSGMRALVDYAHQRGVGVVLYGSAPWIDSRPSTASWWVVQLGFVRDHPDWLIFVEGDEGGATYVYDLSNRELRDYLGGLIRRYLVEVDVDGVLLDMVGIIGPEGGPFRGEPRPPAGQRGLRPLVQTMEIYRSLWLTASRLKPGVWIESGYASPPLARAYAHTWRLADDYPAFSNPYPFAGLLEQVTYAVLQQQLLGRRPHLGFIYGGAETLPIQRQWLGAAVALQAQTILSTDLASVSTETTQMYREYLAALRPFSTTPVFGPGTPPEAFSTTADGATYLGLLNTAHESRTMAVDLVAHGLPPSARALVFDPEIKEAFTTGRSLAVRVPARSFRLVVIRAGPGVLWADRSWTAQTEKEWLDVRVEPSPLGDGQLRLYAPGARRVTIAGRPGATWKLDSPSGLLTVNVPDGGEYRVHVVFGPDADR